MDFSSAVPRAALARNLASQALPPRVAAALWQADRLGSAGAAAGPASPTGFARLDAELPGGGWPGGAVTELLQPHAGMAEWRLLAPAMRQAMAQGRPLALVGPPWMPHPAGLRCLGLDERRLIWIRAETARERLWAAEQLIKSRAAGLLVAWLEAARQEEIRRLQVCAQACPGPIFLCRPLSALGEPSAAAVRIELRIDLAWQLRLRLRKRRGPAHGEDVCLDSVPGGLEELLTPRLRPPGSAFPRLPEDGAGPVRDSHEDAADAVGRPAPARLAATAPAH